MTGSAAIELIGAHKRFGGVTALDGASIVVKAGTIHGLLGENGAGKTTLMRIAYGDLAADRCDAFRVFGAERTFSTPRDAIAAGIGMVHQHPHQVANMTVAENALLGGTGLISWREAATELAATATRVGFGLDVHERMDQLSVASQQKVEILKAVYRKARLLILDEPTAVLAPEEAADLYAWLREFATDGGTAIVITHRLEEARRHTDDVTVLRAGTTVLQSATGEVTIDRVRVAMIGSIEVTSEQQPRHRGAAVANVSNVSVNDAGRTWIRDASFDVFAGEVLGVVGVEGSGHHQLLLALAGRIPHAGRIDRPPTVSLLPEDRHRDAVVLDFDLRDNVAIAGAGDRVGMMDWQSFQRETEDLIGRFDVRAVGPQQLMRELSGGNQQKFVFAREAAGKPLMFVAENPTRGLDIRASAFMRDRLQDLAAGGSAVVIYSSDLDEVLAIADRVLVVFGGAVTVMSTSDRDVVGAAMLGVA